MGRPYHDEETLRELYHSEGLSQKEIAERFGVKSNTISEWMSRNGITTRPHQDAPHKSADLLRHLYHEDGLTTREIGEKLGVSTNTIQYWMQRHGIPRKDANRKQYNIPEAALRRKYLVEKRSTDDIATEYGCTPPIVRARLEEYGISKRSNSDAQRARSGEDVSISRTQTGYLRWTDNIADEELYVHRLAAISDGADPNKVFGGYHVHHKNTHRFDNRPSNLELLTESNHAATHRCDEWTVRDGWPQLVTHDVE
jgi:transposase